MKDIPNDKMWIVFISTYPPRECGIASFTADLIMNFDELFDLHEETKVIAMNTDDKPVPKYSKKVLLQLPENDAHAYREAAKMLNEMSHVKIVSIQHEFGIFGKDSGANIIAFLEEIRKPVTVTLHTVVPRPSEEMRQVMIRIVQAADRLIVMTATAKTLLETVYGANPDVIRTIYHGIHPLPYTESRNMKEKFGLSGRRVLSTFGLLGRGKGIEQGIASLPKIVEQYPDAVYLIIGATHPVVVAREGEAYRNELMDLVKKLGMEKHVIFYDKYFSTPELLKLLQATDIYLALSQNPDQAVSGTLTYALGVGRPVVSTAFMQAREIITSEVGSLVGFGESDSISREVLALFGDEERLAQMGRAAYFRTRGMIWPNIALSYMREFIPLSLDLARREQSLPPIDLSHMRKLTDSFGMLQFAILDEPDPAWGYTLDDNARALIAMAWHSKDNPTPEVSSLAETYLSFLEKSSRTDGGFENYFTGKKILDNEKNAAEDLADANARALWALAVCATSSLPEDLRARATTLFKKQLKADHTLRPPRSAAFLIKSLAAWLEANDDEPVRKILVHSADSLVSLFNASASGEWQWFEDIMTYSNAILPEALLKAYKVTKNEEYLKVAQASLDFLVSQSFEGDVAMPIGQAGWFKKGGVKGVYDQQPEEVSSLVLALQTMHELTGDRSYAKRMHQAFHWFLGNNALNQVVYSQMTGGCYDGLGAKEINLNQGAESTVSYLLARLAVEGRKK